MAEVKLIEKDAAKLRLAALIDSLPLGLVMTDAKGEPLMTNRRLFRMFEYDSNKSMADQLNEFFDLKKLCHECGSKEGACEPQEIQIKSQYIRLLITPIRAGKELHGTVVLMEDITERRTLERTREEFFAIASHELRTPLTAIRAAADMILQYYGSVLHGHEDLAQMIHDIYESSVRLITIVNDFLDMSKLELGKMKFEVEKVDVLSEVKKVIHELEIEASAKKIVLGFEPGEKKAYMALADPNRMHQVITNLIGNAVKFTHEGGVVVEVEQHDKRIEVRVTDTGPGISEENQGLLFRKFQQAGEKVLARDMTRGTGMGLYISKLLTEGMNGTLSLERSAVGEGSTFMLTLPAA
jgi:signal transduction histidine kinase